MGDALEPIGPAMAKFFATLLFLVIAVGTAGFVNYQRNAPLDDELHDRPYGTLSDDDLGALLAAYDMEHRAAVSILHKHSGDRTRIMDGYAAADFGGKVKAFESFQRSNNQWRDTNAGRLELETELEKLETEQRIRERGLHIEQNRILRRLLTF